MSESRLAPVVGREAERTRLQTALAEADGGRTSALVLIGDHGMGKTALGHSVLERRGAASRRMFVSCPPLHSLTSELAPVHAALRRTSVCGRSTSGWTMLSLRPPC